MTSHQFPKWLIALGYVDLRLQPLFAYGLTGLAWPSDGATGRMRSLASGFAYGTLSRPQSRLEDGMEGQDFLPLQTN